MTALGQGHAKRGIARFAIVALSVLSLLVLWRIASGLADPRTLPAPQLVWDVARAEIASGEMAHHLWATLRRVALAFVIAMTLGSSIGIALGMLPALNRFFDTWVVVWLNVPALVVIVLAYVWFGLNEVSAICAVAANKIPNVIVTLREGARALDRHYAEMAQVFRFSRWRILRHVIVPQLAPFLAAAGRSGLSLIWKIVLVVELLGRPDGIGFQIHLYFQLFDVAAILAYTIAFVVVMLGIEWGILQPLERRAARWRTGDAAG